MKYLPFLLAIGGLVMMTPGVSAEPAKLIHEEGKTYLAGVERLGWDMGRSVTFIGALTAAAHAMGDTFTHDYLMGASGVAFKLHMWGQGWCPSAGCAGPGYDVVSKAFDAAGYRMKAWFWFDRVPTEKERAEVIDAIMDSIRSCRPVLYSVEDDALCVGYTEGFGKFITRSYFDTDGAYTETDRWPWIFSVIASKSEPLPRREAVLRSLTSAIEQAETPEFNGYWSGWKAYQEWGKALLDQTPPDDQKAAMGRQQANAFMYITLTDSRNSAHQYLKQVRTELGSASMPHMDRASELYLQQFKVLRMDAHLAPACLQPSDLEKWTPEMRKAQVKTLEAAEELDRQAIAELKLALAASR